MGPRFYGVRSWDEASGGKDGTFGVYVKSWGGLGKLLAPEDLMAGEKV